MEQSRLIYLIGFMLRQVWAFFQLPFPGTNVSIGSICIFGTFVPIVLGFLRSLFGVGGFAQVGEHIRITSSTAKVDRQLHRATNKEAKRFVK